MREHHGGVDDHGCVRRDHAGVADGGVPAGRGRQEVEISATLAVLCGSLGSHPGHAVGRSEQSLSLD